MNRPRTPERYKRKKCKVCKRPFYIKKTRRHTTAKGIRPMHSKTCSNKCSKIYTKLMNGSFHFPNKMTYNKRLAEYRKVYKVISPMNIN